MDWSNILTNASKNFKHYAPEILTALGVTGVVSTAYLTGKASFDASRAIDILESKQGAPPEPKDRIKERTKLVWKLYIPATVSGVVTIGCIVASKKVTGNRTAAAVAAYSLTEKAFSEYREKVVEKIGESKEQKIRDEIKQEHVSKIPLGSREVIILGTGHVLCCELHTGRYFRSDIESLKKAENEINRQIVNNLYVCLDEFYEIIGLSSTSNSDNLGWDSDKLLELEFSAVVSDSGEPCLAFDYNYTKPIW